MAQIVDINAYREKRDTVECECNLCGVVRVPKNKVYPSKGYIDFECDGCGTVQREHHITPDDTA